MVLRKLWSWYNIIQRIEMHQRRQWHPTPVLLPGKSHGRRSLVGCSAWGRWELDTTQWLHFHFSLSCIGEGNGNPLQYSCLENPRAGGAWWVAIYGVAQSRTWLKWLSSSSKAVYCYPAYLAYMQSTSCEMPGWIKHKLESRLQGEIPVPQICRWYHPDGRKRGETEQPVDESEKREWKSWLEPQHSKNEDHGIQSHHFMANRWWKNGSSEKLYFLGLQNHCRWWLQPWN